MRITLESDYALRLILFLAKENMIIDAGTLSEKMCVPKKFALKILRKLMEAGFICSYKGTRGGYRLIQKPEEISIKSIIEALEGKIAVSRCIECDYVCSRMGKDRKGQCALHRAFCAVSEELSRRLGGISIQDILEDSKKE